MPLLLKLVLVLGCVCVGGGIQQVVLRPACTPAMTAATQAALRIVTRSLRKMALAKSVNALLLLLRMVLLVTLVSCKQQWQQAGASGE